MVLRIWLISLTVLVLLSVACGKKEEVKETDVTAGGLPTLTNEVIDRFIKEYPVFQQAADKMRQKYGDLSDDSPVTAAKSTQAIDELEEEVRAKGVDPDYFLEVFRKIIVAAMYINAVEQVKLNDPKQIEVRLTKYRDALQNPGLTEEQKKEVQAQISELEALKVQTEERRAKYEELKAVLDDPKTSEDEKAKIRELLGQLESVFNPEIELPEGLAEEEAAVVRSRFPELITTMQGYFSQQVTGEP